MKRASGKETPAARPAAIDRLMERASDSLQRMRYFEAERICSQALAKAHALRDYERMSRILLPLQECRRQKRQLAVDMGAVNCVSDLGAVADPLPGCFLFAPPLIAADARDFRPRADSAKCPVFVLTREPLARDGRWPLAAVGEEKVIRTKLEPPFPVKRLEKTPTRDDSAGREVPLPWFEAAAEALGDAAIAAISADQHPAWRVEDLLAALSALPEHEKLHQRLEDACREAALAGPPELRRQRPLLDNPFSF